MEIKKDSRFEFKKIHNTKECTNQKQAKVLKDLGLGDFADMALVEFDAGATEVKMLYDVCSGETIIHKLFSLGALMSLVPSILWNPKKNHSIDVFVQGNTVLLYEGKYIHRIYDAGNLIDSIIEFFKDLASSEEFGNLDWD